MTKFHACRVVARENENISNGCLTNMNLTIFRPFNLATSQKVSASKDFFLEYNFWERCLIPISSIEYILAKVFLHVVDAALGTGQSAITRVGSVKRCMLAGSRVIGVDVISGTDKKKWQICDTKIN